MQKNTDISLIIPVFNEEAGIDLLINELGQFISSRPDVSVEVIFVDDGSTDNSVSVFQSKSPFPFDAKLICLSKNTGSHAAVRAGILHARGRFTTMLPADLQDPVSIISDLYRKCSEGFDIVIAHRKIIEGKSSNRLFTRFYAFLMRRYAIPDFPRNGADILMFSDNIKSILNQHIEANSNYLLQILSLGFRQASIEYNKEGRKSGATKWTLGKKVKLLIDSFIGFSYFPIRMVSVVGILMFLTGLVWSVYIIIRTLVFKDLSPGWPTLISIILTGFGITNIALGIIAEYLWRTLDSARKRPVFIINRIIDLNSNQP
jgi:dolichol-phosphate mannosyltransferase